ncbi:MAG: kdo(2)-lipid A phosphoethanolamine 7''-transferase [Betaproteobacteria bacterium]
MMKHPTLIWHLLIGALSGHIAILFNAAIASRRFSALNALHEGAAGLIALEMLLVLFLTGAIFYLLSIAGRVVFKSLACAILVLSAACAYYMVFFNVVIGYGIIQATLTTDVDLSKEVIGFAIIVFVLVFGVFPAFVISRIRLPDAGRVGRLAMFAVCIVAGSAVVLAYPHLLHTDAGKQAKTASPLGVVAHSYVPSNWITGLALSALNSYEGAARQQNLVNPADQFSYRASTNLDGTYLVVIIGESARYDRMGILGHSRANTPEMLKIENLTAMHATSCNTSTKLSLECMFVRPEAVDDGGMGGRQTVSEKMVFSVLKKLGFSSELFSMQGEVWFYNSVESDYYKHRELIYAEERNIGKPIDDLALLPEMQESIDRHPQGKHLVILHTKGSHHFYTARYPRSYAWYTPECANNEVPCGAQELLNSYDNSIAYTDHFLGQVIEKLQDKKAVVIYTSDHGESIGENAHLHGAPKQMAPPEQRMVPLVIWASKPFLKEPRNAARFAGLHARKDLAVSHENLFDSILGCLGVESGDGGIDQRRNLCREQ